MNKNKLSILVILSLLSAGCSNVFTDDLDTFIKETKTKKEKVPEIPKILDVQKVPYIGLAKEVTDPFINSLISSDDGTPQVTPDKDRQKEFLESIPLEQLALMGTVINKKKETEAIVKLEDGTLYVTKVGNYLGQNYGKIKSITDTEIKLVELTQDETGKWIEKENQLSLISAK